MGGDGAGPNDGTPPVDAPATPLVDAPATPPVDAPATPPEVAAYHPWDYGERVRSPRIAQGRGPATIPPQVVLDRR